MPQNALVGALQMLCCHTGDSAEPKFIDKRSSNESGPKVTKTPAARLEHR